MTAPGPGPYHPDYSRLTAYLSARHEQRITLTFTQLEQAILLAPLPYGARSQGSWWSNTPSHRVPHNRAWLDAGWRVAAVDRLGGTVTFERSEQGNAELTRHAPSIAPSVHGGALWRACAPDQP
jgi:hypothetical protein